jgi:hypothetical protein
VSTPVNKDAYTKIVYYSIVHIKVELGMVAHICSPSTEEANSRESKV